MNLIFLDNSNTRQTIPLTDPRSLHVLHILKMEAGQKFYVGLPQGPRGLAEILKISSTDLEIQIQWEEIYFSLHPIECIIGLPRPQTARKVLKDLSSLGIRRIHFFQSDKGESSYAQSSLWTTNEWKNHLLLGAEQAFVTTFPEVHHYSNLQSTFCLFTSSTSSQVSACALDVYEANLTLSQTLKQISPSSNSNLYIYIGSERGWSAEERMLLRKNNISLCHLGPRILRTETACVTACSLALSRLSVF